MAMSEASKLFDQSGGAASGNKQDAVNGAAMTVMKLVVQSKFSGGSIGGGDSGGLGSMMGLVSTFYTALEPGAKLCCLGLQIYVNCAEGLEGNECIIKRHVTVVAISNSYCCNT
jgi:hypothetical protein